MKLAIFFGTGALAICTARLAVAAHPPLDRPTPPPCCADGICYPNTLEWGVYGTRWRRWPTEDLQPTPAAGARAPGQAIPDLPPYETLTPELEDRRAPPPTKRRTEIEDSGEVPSERPLAPPPGGESESPPPSTLTPGPSSPLTPPSPFTTPPSPFSPGPSSPFSPGPSSPSLAPPPTKMLWENGGEPTGDWDPPPALPSATAVTIDRAPAPPTNHPFEPPMPVRPATLRQSPNNSSNSNSDPPPTLPVALASAAF